MVKSSLGGVATGVTVSAITLATISLLADQPQRAALPSVPDAEIATGDIGEEATETRADAPATLSSTPPSIGMDAAAPVAPSAQDAPSVAPSSREDATPRPADSPVMGTMSGDEVPNASATPDRAPNSSAGPSAPTMSGETDEAVAPALGTSVKAPVQSAEPAIPSAESDFAEPFGEDQAAAVPSSVSSGAPVAPSMDPNLVAGDPAVPEMTGSQSGPYVVDETGEAGEADRASTAVGEGGEGQTLKTEPETGGDNPVQPSPTTTAEEERSAPLPATVEVRTERDSSGALVTVYRTIPPAAQEAAETSGTEEVSAGDATAVAPAARESSDTP